MVTLQVAEVIEALPPRETDVLCRLLRGLCEKEIAVELDVSVHTVRGYVRSLYSKFEVSSRAQLFVLLLAPPAFTRERLRAIAFEAKRRLLAAG